VAVAWVLVGVPAHAAAGTVEFFDNFPGRSINSREWAAITGTHHPYSNEIDMPQQARVDATGLHLTASWIGNTGQVASGEIDTIQAFKYGKIEVMARLPDGPGLIPTIWLRNSDTRGLMVGEIDLVEGFGSHPTAFQSTVHHWDHGSQPPADCVLVGWARPSLCVDRPGANTRNLHNAYHDFEVDWLPGRVTFRLDGRAYFTVTHGVPNVPMNLVLGLAAGGWDGPPGANTHLPASQDVQWVRVTSV
jgi:beta-glucanase (GH16 family)